jgi:hypothetical protein
MQRLAGDREHDRDELDDQHDREHCARGAEVGQEERGCFETLLGGHC